MQDKTALAAAGFQLSQKVKWPHTLNEWDIMTRTGTVLSTGSDAECYATAVLTPHSWGTTLGMVLVDPAKRKMGLGTGITKLAINISEEFNAGAIALTASPAAEALYTRLGFIQIGALAVLKRPETAPIQQAAREETKLACSGREISDSFYGGCPSYASILDAMTASAPLSIVERNPDGSLSGFLSSIIRGSAETSETLAIGPIVAQSEDIAEKIVGRLSLACSKAMTCFVLHGCAGEGSSTTTARQNIIKTFNRNGFPFDDDRC